MRRLCLIALLLMMTLNIIPIQLATAQGDNGLMSPSTRLSYTVCEWGLLIIEHPTDRNGFAITNPENYSAIADTNLVVSGTGLFEGGVNIEVRDESNSVIHATTQTVGPSVDAKGTWSVEFGNVDATLGTEMMPISVQANLYSAEGQLVATDSIQLNLNSEFGVRYVEIDSPIGGEAVNDAPLVIRGHGGGAFENNIVIQVSNATTGEILVETFATIYSIDFAGSGPWETTVDLNLPAGTLIQIEAFQPDMSGQGNETIRDIGFGVIEPLRANNTHILMLQADDPLLMSDDLCSLAFAELSNTNITALPIDGVETTIVASPLPTVTAVISGSTAPQCLASLRKRVSRVDSSISIEVYYPNMVDTTACMTNAQPFQTTVPLEQIDPPNIGITVNGVSYQ